MERKTLSLEELNIILEKHEDWLDGKPDGVQADLSYTELGGVNLSGVNLSGANLSGVRLRGIILIGANLRNTNLKDADLQGANLTDANLQNANLQNANLCAVEFCQADLSNANLEHAILCNASLNHTNLSYANLSHVDLRYTFLSYANLGHANLQRANLNKVNLASVNLNYAIFTYKSEFFSASVRCPKCGKAAKMRVSDIIDYAYQCLDCDEDFYSFECPETVSDYQNEAKDFVPLYEITLHKQSVTWYKKHKNTLDKLCTKFNVGFMGCDDSGNENSDEEAFIDFGWKEAPNASMIQKFTDEIMALPLC